jgi:hypothetical protein
MTYEIENVAIDRIYKSTEDREGKPYKSSKGNAFTKVDIYIDPREIDHAEFEGKMTYFDYFGNSDSWDIGTPLTGTVETNESRGKTYFNFNIPTSRSKSVPLDLKDLQIRVARLEGAVFGEEEQGNTPEAKEAIKFTKEALKEEEPNYEDELPF